MSSKQNIKEAISLLCNIFKYHGFTKLTPETFRLAKFNKDEATEPMWKLLFETNCFLNNGSLGCNVDSYKEHSRDIVSCAKHDLFTKRYCVKEFFMLPNDMSHGSREILLAFGWLISKKRLLSILLESCSSLIQEFPPLKEELVAFVKPFLPEKLSVNSQKLSTMKPSDESSDLDTLSWVLGNLRLTCNGLYSAESNLVSMMNKVNYVTLGADNLKGHLSVLEVFLLRHPKELVKFQEKLDLYNSYLEHLLKFLELQAVFWKWMDSVYDLKSAESREDGEKYFETSINRQCDACQEKAKNEQQKVSQTKSEIHNALHDGNRLYITACEMIQRGTLHNGISPSEREWLELNEQITSLSLNTSSNFCGNKLQGLPELRLLSQNKILQGNVKHSEPSCAKQGIAVLKRKLSEIEVELMETRRLHFEILNDLVANIEGIVCIPPISTTKYTELEDK